MLATIMSMGIVLAMGAGMCLVPGLETMIVVSNGYCELFFKAGLFLSLLPWIGMLFLSRGAETLPITMSGLRSNIGDRKMYAYSAGILVVSALGMLISAQSGVPQLWFFVGALLCVGLLLDLLRMTYCRLQFRRTPEGLVEWFTEVLKTSVKKRDEKWHTISYEVPFSLMAVYMKIGAYGSLRLFCQGIADMSALWLGSIARLVPFRIPTEFEETLLDRYMRAEIETAKRIGWLIQEACDRGSLPGLEETTRLAGRLFVTFHNHHESLGLVLLSKLSQISQNNFGKIREQDLDLEVISTASEVVKSLIERCVTRNMPDTASIHSVLEMLRDKVKEIFSREERINPAFVIQPLAEIDHMLGFNRFRSFPGREEILIDLRRIFNLFPVLEGVEESLRDRT